MEINGEGKYFFGSVKVGEKGQIVIPKDARTVFNINSGDNLLVFGDLERGLAVCKSDSLEKFAKMILNKNEEK